MDQETLESCGFERNAADAVARAVNNMSFNAEAFAEFLCHNEHRTLQQNVCRAFYEVLKVWAEDQKSGRFDLRNEDAVTFARFVIDRVREAEANTPGLHFGFRHI